ncbi:xanthine dehydrogenase accessory protein XdhC [Sneathiella sp. P13V-1]|uniref:xanthine dehydrogenase accessory protein XdhC n=1 Tax=Sneathiella sp. P13V-1 TaxID=2697366 RepID=UPI00187B6CC5|nr:xanthine dehydrogenase accessory protein XdhC [Sneathiella sp. P13V-1]MBE7638159.1 xanthine dehydrogenase accessory protein XdhC [Sneathiella sp. P13V-1]
MNDWHDIKTKLEEWDCPALLVTVLRADGSTPREAGTHMLVSATQLAGTIGGGRLEQLAIERCRELLKSGTAHSEKLSLPLGPELAQCCGGYVELAIYTISSQAIIPSEKVVLTWQNEDLSIQFLSEQELSELDTKQTQNSLEQDYRRYDFTLALYGAGHVGKAIVNILAPLPCKIIWVDTRSEEFPAETADNVEKIICRDPAAVATDIEQGALHLIMTHSHRQDYDIVRNLLEKSTFQYAGLIGSKTKWARFRKRLLREGVSENEINRITSPIGQPALKGKHPTEIAISVAADILIRISERNHVANNDNMTDNQVEKSLSLQADKEVGKQKAGAITASKQG